MTKMAETGGPQRNAFESMPPDSSKLAYEAENVVSRFASETHSYISDLIRLADEKTAFFSGASAAMLYLLFNSHAEKYLAWSLNQNSMHSIVALSAMTALSLACVLGLGVVTPRRRSAPPPGHIFFEEIIQYDSRESFATEVMQLSDEQLIREKLTNSYDLAIICSRKYRFLAWQLWSMVIGLILAAPYLLLFSR
jgi:hypothetical protein